MIGLLRTAANHRRAAEQELLKVGSVLAKNGFVGHHRPMTRERRVGRIARRPIRHRRVDNYDML